MGSTVMLDDNQLRRLVSVIYHQEVDAINGIQFSSIFEQSQFLRQCREAHDSVIALLDRGRATQNQLGDDPRAPIAQSIYSYILTCCNNALQTVRNYTVRVEYLKRIVADVDEHLEALNTVDPSDLTNIQAQTKEVSLLDTFMNQYASIQGNTAFDKFTNWVKDSRVTYTNLLQRFQASQGYEGRFSELESNKQLEVYNKIIEVSGRGIISTKAGSEIRNVGVLLYTAGMMVFDMFLSGKKIEGAQLDALVNTTTAIGYTVGSLAGRYWAERMIGADGFALTLTIAGVEASAVTVLAVGVISGFVCGFILGKFVGWFIESIIYSGEVPSSTEQQCCYIVPMPDGGQLARAIAHQ